MFPRQRVNDTDKREKVRDGKQSKRRRAGASVYRLVRLIKAQLGVHARCMESDIPVGRGLKTDELRLHSVAGVVLRGRRDPDRRRGAQSRGVGPTRPPRRAATLAPGSGAEESACVRGLMHLRVRERVRVRE